jgi:hypothetical protein
MNEFTMNHHHSTRQPEAERDPAPGAGEDAGIDAQEDAGQDAGVGHRWNKDKAAEAARLRWAKAREQEAEALASVDEHDTRIVQTPIEVGAIMRRLSRDAKNGSATAAKELRAWLDTYPPTDSGYDLEALDRRTRDRLIARLMAELEAEEHGVGQPVFSPDELTRLLDALERRDGSDTGDWHAQVRHKLRAALGHRHPAE